MRQCERCGIELAWGDGQSSCIVQRPKQISELLCFDCYEEKIRIKGQVNMHRCRARKLGLSDTLTVAEWLETQRDFDYRCAYCRSNSAICLEHFIPLELGGGTVKWNCVPACGACNRKKKNKHPSDVKLIPQEAIERVRTYLTSFL